MTRIITSYLAREIIKTSSATLLILYLILVSHALGRVLGEIAIGSVPQQALWPVLLAEAVFLLGMLLPVSFFLGVIFALGRMYKDHEIVVMNACGVGYRDFYRPVLLALIPFLVCSIYASLWLNAQALRTAQAVIDKEQDLHEFQLIRPGQFNEDKSSGIVFFMESISEDKLELRDVVISQPGSDNDNMVIETAERGLQEIDDKTGNLFLVLGPGNRYEGQAGDPRVKHTSFDEHGILIEKKQRKVRSETHSDLMTLTALWASPKLKHRIELHWRIAIPMVLLVLALLAVPLAYIAPRQGRYGKVGVAMLVFIVYLNLMAFTRSQLEERVIPPELNFWWVHSLFLLLTLVLVYRRNRGVLLGRAGA
jgi:lipopolysaccharide export system permease protein